MTTQQQLPIGVFDSGVGGLTVLRCLQQELPNEHFLYLGDTARLPYGTKSKETVTRYSQQACNTLLERGIKCLVVACNTASSLALNSLVAQHPDVPIIGVLEPGATAAVNASTRGHIAVIATESTINAGSYQRRIMQLDPQSTVSAQSCPLFVPLAEEGWVDGPITQAIAKQYLTPLLEKHKPDTLVLGCTHFPVLLPAIQAVVGQTINIIDSAKTTATAVKETLQQLALLSTTPHSPTQFLVTDSPKRFHDIAKRFLKMEVDESHIQWVDGDLC